MKEILKQVQDDIRNPTCHRAFRNDIRHTQPTPRIQKQHKGKSKKADSSKRNQPFLLCGKF